MESPISAPHAEAQLELQKRLLSLTSFEGKTEEEAIEIVVSEGADPELAKSLLTVEDGVQRMGAGKVVLLGVLTIVGTLLLILGVTGFFALMVIAGEAHFKILWIAVVGGIMVYKGQNP
ncbi:hypothetical protein [Pontibacter sp. G13]|uniref:hypothetical protein n=1 Tax=Pontibacter sp. G13 TaxID=3074898 RepID=UPI002889ACBB|nr:hypothetical protein [Pontibacter sp. G13]WNJ19951.1 hypothetical protein RJD25_05665 [Pontibacter sp. G13]